MLDVICYMWTFAEKQNLHCTALALLDLFHEKINHQAIVFLGTKCDTPLKAIVFNIGKPSQQ